MSEVLSLLRTLAAVDENRQKLAGRIADLSSEEERLRARLAQAEGDFARRKEEHRQLRLTALERAAQADATDAKIREYQKKLEQEIVPYKEMEFLREQVGILRAQLDQLSEEALRLMEAVEEDAKNLVRDEQSYRERRALLEGEIQAIGRKREALRHEQEAWETQRKGILAQLSPVLRQHYERLKEKVPNPVAYVNGLSCGGCHLRLSAATLLKLQEGREVVTCEHCSRFLVLP